MNAKLIFTSLLLSANPVGAQEIKKEYMAEEMLRLCTGEVSDLDKDIQSLVCTFRLQGVAEMMVKNCSSMELGYTPVQELSSNKPPSIRALRQAFINYMEDNPEEWGRPWFDVAALATSETFPCPY